MLISFVIPVYNVEQYLQECVDSILNQSVSDYEILLVDDGSTDGSGALCDGYASREPRIRVIHKPNGGLSDARNRGLEAARGEYVLFVDSDDFIGEGSLEALAASLAQSESRPDVTFLEAVKRYPDGREEPLGDGYEGAWILNQDKERVMAHLSRLPKFPGSACTKLVRRELLIAEKLFFQKDLLSEDLDWTVRLLLAAETFSYCGTPYYYYRQGRDGSITNTAGRRSVESLLQILERWGSREERPFWREVNAFMAYEYVVLLFNFAALDASDRKQLGDRVGKLRWLLAYGTGRKTKLVGLAVRGLGVNATARLLRIYKK